MGDLLCPEAQYPCIAGGLGLGTSPSHRLGRGATNRCHRLSRGATSRCHCLGSRTIPVCSKGSFPITVIQIRPWSQFRSACAFLCSATFLCPFPSVSCSPSASCRFSQLPSVTLCSLPSQLYGDLSPEFTSLGTPVPTVGPNGELQPHKNHIVDALGPRLVQVLTLPLVVLSSSLSEGVACAVHKFSRFGPPNPAHCGARFMDDQGHMVTAKDVANLYHEH